MELIDELAEIRKNLYNLTSKSPHCDLGIMEAVMALDYAIEEQQEFEGTEPTDADLKHMGQELWMEGERE